MIALFFLFFSAGQESFKEFLFSPLCFFFWFFVFLKCHFCSFSLIAAVFWDMAVCVWVCVLWNYIFVRLGSTFFFLNPISIQSGMLHIRTNSTKALLSLRFCFDCFCLQKGGPLVSLSLPVSRHEASSFPLRHDDWNEGFFVIIFLSVWIELNKLCCDALCGVGSLSPVSSAGL